MSWFRSSRRRRAEAPPAPPPAPSPPTAEESPEPEGGVALRERRPRSELQGLHLAELHRLARESALPGYRLLRRDELIAALSGEDGSPAETEAPPRVRIEEAKGISRDVADEIGGLVRQLSSSAPAPTAGELRRIVDHDATTLLLARDGGGGVVGTLTLVLFTIPTGVRAWIEDVVVDEHARGRGVGEALTQEALSRARAAGARTVDLTSRPEREAANRMYSKVGFARRQTHVFRYEL